MTGILLAPGAVASHKAVKSLSRVFNLAVTKTKFETAAKQLQSMNFGALVMAQVRGKIVFVKRDPVEVMHLLELPENKDLCTAAEYRRRYHEPIPSYNLGPKARENLLQMGLGLVPSQLLPGSTGMVEEQDSLQYHSLECNFDIPQQLSPARLDLEDCGVEQKCDTHQPLQEPDRT